MSDASNNIYVNSTSTIFPIGMKNSEELDRFLRANYTMLGTLCGVQFDDELANAEEFPENININIR